MRRKIMKLRLLAGTLLLLTSLTIFGQENTSIATMPKVMEAHDDLMDQMPKLSKYINKLQTRANASYKKEKYENAIADLKQANASMMEWMSGFGKRFDSDEMHKGKPLTEQKQMWLVEEDKKIALLKKEIDLSLAQAEKVLGN